MKGKVYDCINAVKRNAEEDRALAKQKENYSTSVYFQGKIAACNELLELLRK